MEWTGARYSDTPTVQARTWIDAPPDSSELQSVEWLDGASGATLGARFVGRNRHEAMGEWTATSQIVEFEPGRVFAWAVGDPGDPAATWRFRLEPMDGGTELSQLAARRVPATPPRCQGATAQSNPGIPMR